MAEDLSLEHRTRLATTKEEADELKDADFLRNQNIMEEQKRVARNSRPMEGKMKRGSGGTAQIRIVEEDRSIKELVNRLGIENAITKDNEKIGHQTERGRQFLILEFIQSLGNHGEGYDTSTVLDGPCVCPESTTKATKEF